MNKNFLINQIISFKTSDGGGQGKITDVLENDYEINESFLIPKSESFFLPSELSTDALFFNNLPKNYSFANPTIRPIFQHPLGDFTLTLEFQKQLSNDLPLNQPFHHFLYHCLDCIVMDPSSEQDGSNFYFFSPYSNFLFLIDIKSNLIITYRHSSSYKVKAVKKDSEFLKTVKSERKLISSNQQDLVFLLKSQLIELGLIPSKTRSGLDCFESDLLRIAFSSSLKGMELNFNDKISGKGVRCIAINKIVNLKQTIESVENSLPYANQQSLILKTCEDLSHLGFISAGSTETGAQRLKNKLWKATLMISEKGVKVCFSSKKLKKATRHMLISEISNFQEFLEELESSSSSTAS